MTSIELILKDSGELVAYAGGFGFRCRTLGFSPIFKIEDAIFDPPTMEKAAKAWIKYVHDGARCRRANGEDVEQFYPTKDELERFLAGAGT